MSSFLSPSSSLSSPDRRLYRGGAIVQLVRGNPRRPGADVMSLASATIEVTLLGVVARAGSDEWTWLLDEIEDIVHGPDGTWTILAVPGVPDHGVAVDDADVHDFRAAIDEILAVDAAGPSDQWMRLTHDDMRDDGPADGWLHLERALTAPPDPDLVDRQADRRRLDVRRWDARPDDELEAPSVFAAPLDPPPVVGPTPEPRPSGPSTAMSPRFAPEDAGLAALEASSISAWFGAHHVLDRVSLTMHPGEVTALIGPSGCGKSTFLRILNRMHEMIPGASLAGDVRLDGVGIYDASRKLIDARRQIGMVFQKPNPFPAMSIYDNVVASFRLTGMKATGSEKDAVVETCLTKAGLWNEVRDRLRQPGGSLSGGQQQRLCIARALAIRPRVLLMDEPCSALDPTSTRRIEQTIVELRSEVTIVIVTHNMQQAARVSNRCAFFLAEAGTPGVIVEHGDTEAMFHAPQDERTSAYVNGRFG